VRARTPGVIGEIALIRAELDPDSGAVVDGSRRMTWAELAVQTNRLANALADVLSVRKGDRVAFVGQSSLEAFELWHAVPRLGALVVPLNERLAVAELERIVEKAAPLALVHDEAFGALAKQLADTVGLPRVGIGTDARFSFDDLVDGGSPADPGVDVGPDDASSICFTSGTTGSPKGAVMRHRAQIEFARGQTIIEPIRPGARHLFVRPMSVAPGHRMAAWHGLGGGTTVLIPRFDPAQFFRTVETERATNVLLAPTMLRMLLDHGNADGRDLTSLRTIVYGGAPMPRELLAEVLAFFPCALVQGYGSTEAGQMLYLSDADHRAGRLRSNGRPVPGVDVSIRTDDGAEAPNGEVGELHVRSPQLMGGYWLDPDKTAEVLRDGWYATGDLCTHDPDGTYRVVGRASDMIISGGFNIMPSEVEHVLSAHPAVSEVAVYGVQHRLWGEAVHATVVLEPDAGAVVTAEELIALCRQQLASFKRPRAIEFAAALPLTAAGKIDKATLARRRFHT
jgi:acyl-CoA synthetase (AMP-forming)/AMP-acid ligase II